jgi:23S rRNA pseudouridine1911/1915/1917 synthase
LDLKNQVGEQNLVDSFCGKAFVKKFELEFDCASQAATRIDVFLFEKFPEYSRSFFKKIISCGGVFINDKIITKSSYILKPGDKITGDFTEKRELKVTPKKVDFVILDENDDFLIVDKPAGLTVHPVNHDSFKEDTLVEGLLEHLNNVDNFEHPERPGIVHRIDKNTSGVLIVAKNPKAQIELSKIFKDRTISKAYIAVVSGHPDKEGTVDYPVGRHPIERHKMSHKAVNGKESFTQYKVLEYFKNEALVEVSILTGRTHQIRVHFAAIGHSVFGDKTYGRQSKLIDRHALHAWKIKFNFRGQVFSYECPLPEDMKDLIEKLKAEPEA